MLIEEIGQIDLAIVSSKTKMLTLVANVVQHQGFDWADSGREFDPPAGLLLITPTFESEKSGF